MRSPWPTHQLVVDPEQTQADLAPTRRSPPNLPHRWPFHRIRWRPIGCATRRSQRAEAAVRGRLRGKRSALADIGPIASAPAARTRLHTDLARPRSGRAQGAGSANAGCHGPVAVHPRRTRPPTRGSSRAHDGVSPSSRIRIPSPAMVELGEGKGGSRREKAGEGGVATARLFERTNVGRRRAVLAVAAGCPRVATRTTHSFILQGTSSLLAVL